MLLQATICLLMFAGVTYCQNSTSYWNLDFYCNRLKVEDCNSHNISERCGTDRVTYRNGCELGKAYCSDHSIHQAHEGPCTGDPHATRSPEEVQHGSAVILDFECMYLAHRTCQPNINEKICGTDGKTYANFCEYEKARCMHRNLHVAKLGDCNA